MASLSLTSRSREGRSPRKLSLTDHDHSYLLNDTVTHQTRESVLQGWNEPNLWWHAIPFGINLHVLPLFLFALFFVYLFGNCSLIFFTQPCTVVWVAKTKFAAGQRASEGGGVDWIGGPPRRLLWVESKGMNHQDNASDHESEYLSLKLSSIHELVGALWPVGGRHHQKYNDVTRTYRQMDQVSYEICLADWLIHKRSPCHNSNGTVKQTEIIQLLNVLLSMLNWNRDGLFGITVADAPHGGCL